MFSRDGIGLGFGARRRSNAFLPALSEIEFAWRERFSVVQFYGQEFGLEEVQLGASLDEVSTALTERDIAAVMEMVIRVDGKGLTDAGQSPYQVLMANLPAITALPCVHVHWHLVPTFARADYSEFESSLLDEFLKAVKLAGEHGFKFGFEHNEPDLGLFASPESVAAMLDKVNGLGLVWDLNHTPQNQWVDYLQFVPRMSMLHISDTPLPELNYHLPIGEGSIVFSLLMNEVWDRGFRGFGILEVGGLPKSGGYGKDTNEALRESRYQLLKMQGPS